MALTKESEIVQMNNSNIWRNIYDTTDFGNKYPSSYMVSLFHARIKPLLMDEKKNLSQIRVLDFGCSVGANSIVYQNLGMETFGIDVSEKAIERLIDSGIGDTQHFKALNLLDGEVEINDVFCGVRFDYVIASEIMYYFKNEERIKLLDKFMRAMNSNAVLYVSMPTYNMPLYSKYGNVDKNSDGMIEVSESGSIKSSLLVNLPRNIDEAEDMFKPFRLIDIMTVNTPLFSGEDFVEYHLLLQK